MTKIHAIAAKAADNLVHLFTESEDKLDKAIIAAVEEAQANDATAKFRISFAITLDLDAGKMATDLSFSTRTKLTVDGRIPDPNQTEIKFDDEEKPEVKAGGEE